MDRKTFEFLRDLPGKVIEGDIVLKPKKPNSRVLISGAVAIVNSASVAANLYIEFNPDTDAKTFNVMVVGTGPICRLEVDAQEHPPFGRSHKHAWEDGEVPEMNLKKDITQQSRLSGRSLSEVFAEFCRTAHIEHDGELRE